MTDVNQTQAAVETGVKFADIKAKYDKTVTFIDKSFHFKTVEDKETGAKSKRPTVEIPLPIPSLDGIVAILEGGNAKQQQLLLDAVQEIVASVARELINENESIKADNFPYEKLSWAAIAEMPAAERRGGGISKETWKEFGEVYAEVMPSVTGKSAEQVANVAKILVAKFQPVRAQKKIIQAMLAQLTLFASQPQAADYAECIEFLVNKADKLLNMTEEDALANLGL